MLMKIWQCAIKLILYPALLAGALAVSAAVPDMRLTGLAMHQETGRNIYLGGIYFDQYVPTPDNLIEASGPKLMEYRVVARRTSIRSLLGGMLLQSELASGNAPDASVTSFVNDLLASVQGSLYSGDSLQILLTEDDQTVAFLNGQELARVDDGRVSDYLLAGWIGEQGPSTAFRNSIGAETVDPDLLALLKTTAYTSEREQQVAGWISTEQEVLIAQTTRVETPEAEPAIAAALPAAPTPQAEAPAESPEKKPEAEAAVPQPTIETLLAATGEPSEPVTADREAGAIMATSAAAVATARAREPEVKKPHRALEKTPAAPGAEAVQVAALMPDTGLPAETASDAISALDIQDYSQRLAAFNTQVLKRVYAEIQYPQRAVRRGLQGRVELDVTLQESGELLEITIVQSSGYKILDKAAAKAAGKALASMDSSDLDPVAIAEYGDENEALVVPVPIQFMLTE
jgi:TonB family protein